MDSPFCSRLKRRVGFCKRLLFDDEVQVLYDRVSIRDVPPMTDEDYQVGGCTALLDAIGTAAKFGIHADHAVDCVSDAEGTSINYEVLNETISDYRSVCTSPCDDIPKEWKKKIESTSPRGRFSRMENSRKK